jgi:hypothetical protein
VGHPSGEILLSVTLESGGRRCSGVGQTNFRNVLVTDNIICRLSVVKDTSRKLCRDPSLTDRLAQTSPEHSWTGAATRDEQSTPGRGRRLHDLRHIARVSGSPLPTLCLPELPERTALGT